MSNIEQMQGLNDKLFNNTMEINSILEVVAQLPVNQKPERLSITPSKDSQVHRGMYDRVTVDGEPNLVSENIKEGTSIFGVEGSAKTLNAVFTDGANLFSSSQKTPDLVTYVNEFAKLCDWKQFMSCGSMFYNNKNLINLTIKDASPNSITNMTQMFSNCSNLTELDLGDLDTSKVTNMQSMFSSCSNLTELNLSNFNTSNVQTMYSMFSSCKSLTKLDLSSFDTSSVTNMQNMFSGSTNLEELDISSFNTSNVTNMSSMFSSCSNLTELDLSNFNTSNVITMGSMFSYCTNLTELDLSSFNTSNVTTMNSMFSNCSNLTELDLSNFNTSNVITMGSMFSYCTNLTELDLSSFDMGNVTNISGVIQKCNSLKNLKFGKNLGKAYTQQTENYSNYTIIISDCQQLTHDSLMDIINNLYDLNLTYDVANGGTLYRQKLQLYTNLKQRLTAEEIAIATNKGWNVT